MNAVLVAIIASLAVVNATPSGHLHGGVLVGPLGHGLGLGLGGVVGVPALGLGHVHGLGWGHGVSAITNGGGVVSATAHGAAVHGPATAPVVVSGPAGHVAADGLWGPTHNIGLHHHGW